jgi:hypothetical protein
LPPFGHPLSHLCGCSLSHTSDDDDGRSTKLRPCRSHITSVIAGTTTMCAMRAGHRLPCGWGTKRSGDELPQPARSGSEPANDASTTRDQRVQDNGWTIGQMRSVDRSPSQRGKEKSGLTTMISAAPTDRSRYPRTTSAAPASITIVISQRASILIIFLVVSISYRNACSLSGFATLQLCNMIAYSASTVQDEFTPPCLVVTCLCATPLNTIQGQSHETECRRGHHEGAGRASI